MRDYVEEWVQRYFDCLSRGTIAEGAKIVIERIPITLHCQSCSTSFNVHAKQDVLTCPGCNSDMIKMVSGRDFRIERIGII